LVEAAGIEPAASCPRQRKKNTAIIRMAVKIGGGGRNRTAVRKP
jgi:hypothetical protein